MLDRIFTRVAGAISGFAGQPAAFIIATGSIVVWALTGPLFGYSDTWQLVVNTSTTIVTFLMVFLIQNAQNRDGAAMQAKLDELIRSHEGARDAFIGIEHLTDHQIEQLRARLERDSGPSDGHGTAAGSVGRLLDRY